MQIGWEVLPEVHRSYKESSFMREKKQGILLMSAETKW